MRQSIPSHFALGRSSHQSNRQAQSKGPLGAAAECGELGLYASPEERRRRVLVRSPTRCTTCRGTPSQIELTRAGGGCVLCFDRSIGRSIGRTQSIDLRVRPRDRGPGKEDLGPRAARRKFPGRDPAPRRWTAPGLLTAAAAACDFLFLSMSSDTCNRHRYAFNCVGGGGSFLVIWRRGPDPKVQRFWGARASPALINDASLAPVSIGFLRLF